MPIQQEHLFLFVDPEGRRHGHFIMSERIASQHNRYLDKEGDDRRWVRADEFAGLGSNAMEHSRVESR